MHTALLPFLCASLRGHYDPAGLLRVRDLAPRTTADWEAAQQAIYDEGLAPLIYIILRGQELLPPRLEADLADAYEANAVRNTGLLCELEAALIGLAQAGIPTILLKGAALAEAVYGNAAVRPMADGDLLVRPAQVPAALAVLEQLGYAPTEAEPRGGDAVRYESQIALSKPGPLLARIELHWGLLDAPYYQARLPLAWFWATATPLRLGAASALRLGLEAELLYLCAHLFLHHRGQGLMWWQDIAEVIHAAAGRVDWARLLEQAQASDLLLPLQQVLPRLATDWAAVIPTETLAQLAQLRPSSGEARVYAWLTAAERPVAQRFWADLASIGGWRARIRYAWSNLVPSASYMQQRYAIAHPLLTGFYYPYRWWVGLRSAWIRSQRV